MSGSPDWNEAVFALTLKRAEIEELHEGLIRLEPGDRPHFRRLDQLVTFWLEQFRICDEAEKKP